LNRIENSICNHVVLASDSDPIDVESETCVMLYLECRKACKNTP
jgi:hypothetical protein